MLESLAKMLEYKDIPVKIDINEPFLLYICFDFKHMIHFIRLKEF